MGYFKFVMIMAMALQMPCSKKALPLNLHEISKSMHMQNRMDIMLRGRRGYAKLSTL